ncbi:MAG TPA: molybdenum cofactor biosynthesis protein MoaE [Nitrospiraceae bacterium]|nr:molybdenum cofactor biosynthesis protein MoaE [Nitrospiraceae bacterium]
MSPVTLHMRSDRGYHMVTVRLFGMTKGLAGNQESLSFSLAGARRVRDLVGVLDARYPQIGELIHKKKILVSVNQEIAHEELELQEGDEVALLPPFAGGSGMSQLGEASELVRVQRENFSIDAEIDRVRSRSKRIGGIAVFLGTARDRSKGRDVESLTFEHYEGMAQKKLREIRERALKDFDVIEVLILHRYGEIAIGENIVLIVVGAEHRADAFRACKWAIDELKQITPIWKREQTPEGDVWVEEHP